MEWVLFGSYISIEKAHQDINHWRPIRLLRVIKGEEPRSQRTEILIDLVLSVLRNVFSKYRDFDLHSSLGSSDLDLSGSNCYFFEFELF